MKNFLLLILKKFNKVVVVDKNILSTTFLIKPSTVFTDEDHLKDLPEKTKQNILLYKEEIDNIDKVVEVDLSLEFEEKLDCTKIMYDSRLSVGDDYLGSIDKGVLIINDDELLIDSMNNVIQLIQKILYFTKD